ncbi:MAG: diacylglycerol kinase family protein [Pseudomonadota bacterium]
MSMNTYLNPTQLAADRTAVMLNINAKKVTSRVVDRVAQVVPHTDLFLSRSFDDARKQVETVVARGYGRVLAGGGDGTLVTLINLIDRTIRRCLDRGQQVPFPEMGMLRLGTGNAVASVLGAGSLIPDVKRHLRGEDQLRVQLDMLRVGDQDTLCPFAGIGYDGEILGDYNWVKAHAQNPVAKALMQTSLGYLAGLFLRTLPRKLAEFGRNLPEIEVRARGRAFRVDHQANDALVRADDELLYRGPVGFAGAGTVPVYGFNFRVFPFAGRVPGLMHLRVTDVSALTAVANLGGLWRGTWRHPQLHDFLVEGVEIVGDRPLPYQLGGDAAGARANLDLRVAEQPLAMAALAPPRLALPAAA